MKPPAWLATVVNASQTLALDNEGDRLSLIQALQDAHAKHCRVCDANLTGKTNRTHFTTPDGTKPCPGSWL